MVSKREQLLDAALAVFRERGYHAAGIDTILARAGVAKMTLYKHFRSKEDLVLAALRRADEDSRRWLIGEMERRASDPRGRLLALFDAAADWFASPDFRGCLFVRASSEFTDADDPVRAACHEHNTLLKRHLRDLARDAGAVEPAALAEQVFILFVGAIAAAQCCGTPGPARSAREAASALLERALPSR